MLGAYFILRFQILVYLYWFVLFDDVHWLLLFVAFLLSTPGGVLLTNVKVFPLAITLD